MAVSPRGNSWLATVFIHGAKVRKTFPTKELAEEWAEKSATGHATRGKKETPDEAVTWKSAADATFDRCFNGKKWAHKNRLALDRIERLVGPNKPLEEVTALYVDGLVTSWEREGLGASTINGRLALVSRVLRYAEKQGLIKQAPRLERAKVLDGRIRWLTGDEEVALLAHLRSLGKEEHAEVVTCLIDTGMRPSEFWAMAAKDVRLDRGEISIWTNKTGKPRTILMTDRVRDIIAAKVASTEHADAPLFPRDNAWLLYGWNLAKHAMGLDDDADFVPYVCRHTCASRLIQRGLELSVVQKWLGHKNPSMTARYAHLGTHNLASAKEALQKGATD